MAGEGREVDVQVVEVDGHVRDGLAGVEHRQRADLLRPADDLGDVGDDTGDVRLVGEGHDLDGLVEFDGVEVDAAVLGDGVPLQLRARAAGQLLPRHEVGVVLELRDDDGVVGGHPVPARAVVAEGVGHGVEALGGVLDEGDLVPVGADERGDLLARVLVGVGGLLRELVGAAVDRCERVEDELLLRPPHPQRTLRGGAGVQVDQGLLVTHGAREDRELGPDLLDVHRAVGLHVSRHHRNWS